MSLAVFLLIVLSASYLLYRLRANMDATNEKHVLAASASAAFDSLAYSEGYPPDWNQQTVLSVGLAAAGSASGAGGAGEGGKRIDAAKLLRFAKLNYSDARALLGLGAYDFQLTFSEEWNASEQGQGAALAAGASHSGVALEPIAYFAADDKDAFSLLDGRNVSWDYYWAGSGNEPDHGDATRFYSAAQYGGKTALFNALLANASNASAGGGGGAGGAGAYNTIVIEQPNFTTTEYAGVNQSALRAFLRARGVLVFEGSVSAADAQETPLLLNDLNESFLFSEAPSQGVVNTTLFFLDNASAGDAASFTQSRWLAYRNASSAGDAPLLVFVQNASNASLALVGRWECENGRVYYVADFDAAFGAGGGTPGSRVFNLVGARLEFGVEPSAGEAPRDAFVVQRAVIIQRDWGSLAAVRLVVWKT